MTFDNPIYVKLKPAKLEEDEDFVLNDYAGKVGVSVGWGSTQKWEVDKPTLQIDISSHLKKVNLPIISHADCVELLSQPIDITFGGRVICTKANTPEGPCEVFHTLIGRLIDKYMLIVKRFSDLIGRRWRSSVCERRSDWNHERFQWMW